ncbi:Spx/MgsR family RNA polymerase-binding regulatory protein [Atopobacter phocae]|uniref:Spx/MgsR family RNA polymerase-binding regulatory protein n=1 Tax=Atopobacter phocae TaxID=136492 RepID=UPI0004718D06|nr:Spx/MgsR family RNA polymerase-binding regulatory protein [Atopobacter phocae]
MQFIGYSKCSTCKGIKALMEEKGLTFDVRDIKENRPSKSEIKQWHEQSGLDISKFFNTSGQIYRQNNLKEKRLTMSLDEQYQLLSEDGMLVKRPILLVDESVYIGPLVKKYVESL